MKAKILFFIGKGGVGKSTVSSLYGLSLAKQNNVLLVSLDSAHNLSDIFEESFSDKPKIITQNLSVIEVNVNKKIKEYLQSVENDLVKSNTNLTAFNLLDEFNIIKHSPGLEEYGLLKAYEDIVKQYSDTDFLIFDMPPTALSLKFFNLPSRSLLWIEKLIKLRERIKEKKEVVSRIKIGKKEIEKDRILEKLLIQKGQYSVLKENLKSSSTKINLVVNEDKLSINEGLNIIEDLKDLEISVGRIIANKTSNNSLQESEFKNYECVVLPDSKKQLIGLQNLKNFIDNDEFSW